MSTPSAHPDGIPDSQHASMEQDEALQGVTTNLPQIALAIDSEKKKAEDDRTDSISKRMEDNRAKMAKSTADLHNLSLERGQLGLASGNGRVNLLQQRMQEAAAKQKGAVVGTSPTYIFQPMLHTINVKDVIRPTILPKVEKMPRYTSWIFIKRNRLMTEDQPIVGQSDGEALVCSDSDFDMNDGEEVKKEFVESEDKFIRSVIEDVGSSDDVYKLLAQELSRKPCEIKARYEDLVSEQNAKDRAESSDSMSSLLDKNLEEATDSFDKLFCRICFIFDCKLHGCSQEVIIPAERRSTQNKINEELVSSEPCGPNCYLQVQLATLSTDASGVLVTNEKSHKTEVTSTKLENVSESSDSDTSPDNTKRARKDSVFPADDQQSIGSNDIVKNDKFVEKNVSKQARAFETWRTLEKSLFETGQQIFGKHSCLIARNTMCGLKTCVEVFNALRENENKGTESADSQDNCSTTEISSQKKGQTALGKKSSFVRRKGKGRRLKFTRVKSNGPHSMRKGFSDNNNLNWHQYNPCGCLSICGNDCPCFAYGITCEKYCGCPKSCRNRYRGCFCGKGQCRTRQCPCFALDRECDPDVCRNCWVSCGDGTVVKTKKGESYECDNMKLLLGQHQRILLGLSDVSGFGAFIWNDVSKDEFLGEYTGELISHEEADRRGEIYDREDCSYLFNLNDQYVLDAYRMGNKLKFANHSANPNCYAKIMMVSGDHRVGIFAKEDIKAGEELFYDYMYEYDNAPAWAQKPGDSGPRNDHGASTSKGRPKKLA